MNKKWGKNPKRYAALFFLNMCSWKNLEKRHRKVMKEYSHLSLLQGTVQHTIDDVLVCFTTKILPLIIQNLSLLQNRHLSPLKIWSVHVHHHMVIRDLEFCMPSSVRWTMAPSHIINGFLPLFSNIFCSALVTAKKAWLNEIIGTIREEKEEEPEGEVLGDDSTGNSICPLFLTLLSKFTLASVCTAFYNSSL